MKTVRTLAILFGVMCLTAGTAAGQEMSFPLGTYATSSYPLPPSGLAGLDSRAFWPEPLPILSTYPLTPSVQPLPQLRVPRLPAYGIVLLPQPITANALTTFVLSGPFSTQVSFGGSLSFPIDWPFLISRLDPLVVTPSGALRPLITEPICRENLFPSTDVVPLSLFRLR